MWSIRLVPLENWTESGYMPQSALVPSPLSPPQLPQPSIKSTPPQTPSLSSSSSYPTSPSTAHCSMGRSMHTIHSNLYQTTDYTHSFPGSVPNQPARLSETLTDSAVDFCLNQRVVAKPTHHSDEVLRCADPWAQEHTVTALLSLSLHEANRVLITNTGEIKSLIYVLKTGTETSKQNAACALLSLSLVEENKVTIGAIPPLVGLLIHRSCRGEEGCVDHVCISCVVLGYKERAGAVGPLVEMVVRKEGGNRVREKAMVVLSSLAGVEEGKTTIVEEGGIAALVEAVEDGSPKGKEFAV